MRESLERASNMGMMPSALLELEYPFAELLLCVGFLLILLIESVVHKMFGGAGQHRHLQHQYMMDCVQVMATLMEATAIAINGLHIMVPTGNLCIAFKIMCRRLWNLIVLIG